MQSRKNTEAFYEEHGFRVLGNLGSVGNLTESDNAELLKLMKSSRAFTIFDKDIGEAGTRKQFNLYAEGFANKKKPSYNISFLEPVHDQIMEEAPGIKTQIKFYPSLIYSAGQNDYIQPAHHDLARKGFPAGTYLLLVALMDKTTLIILRRSHIGNPYTSTLYYVTPLRLTMNKGDYVMFHPNLVHCGDAYQTENVRLHYYVLHYHAKLSDMTVVPPEYVLNRCNNPETIRIMKGCVTRGEKKLREERETERRRQQMSEFNEKRRLERAALAAASRYDPPSISPYSRREIRLINRSCNKFMAEEFPNFFKYDIANSTVGWDVVSRAFEKTNRAAEVPHLEEANTVTSGIARREIQSGPVGIDARVSKSGRFPSNFERDDVSECNVVYLEEDP